MENTYCVITILFLYSYIFCKNELLVNAELLATPLWNANGTGNASELCSLVVDNGDHGDVSNSTIVFTGDAKTICGIRLMTPAERGTLIQISHQMPRNTFLYVEKQGYLSYCQNRFVVIAADKPCYSVFPQTNLQLFLQGTANVLLSDIRISQSPLFCGVTIDGTNNSKVESVITIPKMQGVNRCPVKEYNHSISCDSFLDHICSFKFPSYCNATFGNRYVEFKCNISYQASHTAVIIYPNNILELDLSIQNILELSEYALIHLHDLIKLDVSYNMLSVLHSQVFAGLKVLRILYLQGNKLRALPNDLFEGLGNLETLYLYRNQIMSLDGGLFTENTKLIYLSLRDNNLMGLPKGVFKGLVNLEKLYLRGNQIKLFHWTNVHSTRPAI